MMLSHALKKSRAYGSMLDSSRLENGSTTTGVAGPFFQNVKPPMKTCESTGSNQKKETTSTNEDLREYWFEPKKETTST